MTALKSYRERRGLSQRRLARQAGVAYKTVQLLEAGGRDVRWSTLTRLAKALELSDPEALVSSRTQEAALTASKTADHIREDGPESWRLWLLQFVDEFRRRPRLAAAARAPEPGLSPRMLALLASSIEALCAEAKLRPPWWCAGVPSLSEPWFPAQTESLKATALVESPAAFGQRNIFVLGNFLARA